jgi:hypothetical protein
VVFPGTGLPSASPGNVIGRAAAGLGQRPGHRGPGREATAAVPAAGTAGRDVAAQRRGR